jgi:hypothetical protein
MKIRYRNELIKLIDHFGLPRTVAEIGVAEGRFSEEIYRWNVDALFLVDIWETIPFIDGCASFDQEWHDVNYKRVVDIFGSKENVAILKGFSHKMANNIDDGSLGLAYVDSDHTYQGCKSDIKIWWPKLAPGGIMAFHDYGNLAYGVNRAVIEYVEGERYVNVIEEDGDIANIGAWIRK